MVESIPTLAAIAPAVKFIELAVPPIDGCTPHNPSIARAADGFLCTVRMSNTRIANGRYYIVGKSPVRSEYFLARLDDELRITAIELLADGTDPGPRFPARARGFIDLRVFRLPDGWKAVAATVEYSEKGVNQMALLDLEVDRNRISNATILSSPLAGNQKNWMPVAGVSQPLLVTHCHPTVVIAIDLEAGVTLPIVTHATSQAMQNFRGGSQLVPFADGYVCVIHEVTSAPGGGRLYLHRFIRFDREFRIDAMSPAFVFRLREVEFAAGMTHWNGHFVIGFGENDVRAFVALVPNHQVMALLEPVV